MVIDVLREEVADGLVLRSSRGRFALAATVAASAMAILDATVVNVALPHIWQEFGASVGELQWVLTGYLLALASLILLGGALGDRFGAPQGVRDRHYLVRGGVCWLQPPQPFLARSLRGCASRGVVLARAHHDLFIRVAQRNVLI